MTGMGRVQDEEDMTGQRLFAETGDLEAIAKA